LLKRTNQVSPYDLASAVAAKLTVSVSKIKLPKELIGFRNGRSLSNMMTVKASATFFEKDIISENFKV
jgi:hypothetical protein